MTLAPKFEGELANFVDLLVEDYTAADEAAAYFSNSRFTKLASSPSTLVLVSCIRPSSLPEALLVTTQRQAKLFQRSETKPPLSPSQGSLQIDMQLVILTVLLIYSFKRPVLPWGL